MDPEEAEELFREELDELLARHGAELELSRDVWGRNEARLRVILDQEGLWHEFEHSRE